MSFCHNLISISGIIRFLEGIVFKRYYHILPAEIYLLHLILRPEQLAEEFKGCLDLALYCLDTLGLREDCTFRFSQWDPKRTDKYEGTPEQWDEAQGIMEELLDENLGRENYSIGVDEAAFYGPKLDIQIKNVFGKEDTLITIQIDDTFLFTVFCEFKQRLTRYASCKEVRHGIR